MRRVAAVLLFALATGGCGGNDASDSDELTVSAASSLTEPLEAYGETTDADERFSFAGSDDLAAQIREGAPVDVFAAANTSLPEALFDEGLVEESEVFISNQLVLAVPAGSNIVGIGGLVREEADLVIGAEGVPVGDYTREVIGRQPETEARAILANVRSEEPDVGGVVGKLTQGAADAGLLYITDVTAAEDDVRAIELPDELQPSVEYGVAVVKGAKEPEAARRFIDGLLEGAGLRAMRRAGFEPPPASP